MDNEHSNTDWTLFLDDNTPSDTTDWTLFLDDNTPSDTLDDQSTTTNTKSWAPTSIPFVGQIAYGWNKGDAANAQYKMETLANEIELIKVLNGAVSMDTLAKEHGWNEEQTKEALNWQEDFKRRFYEKQGMVLGKPKEPSSNFYNTEIKKREEEYNNNVENYKVYIAKMQDLEDSGVTEGFDKILNQISDPKVGLGEAIIEMITNPKEMADLMSVEVGSQFQDSLGYMGLRLLTKNPIMSALLASAGPLTSGDKVGRYEILKQLMTNKKFDITDKEAVTKILLSSDFKKLSNKNFDKVAIEVFFDVIGGEAGYRLYKQIRKARKAATAPAGNVGNLTLASTGEAAVNLLGSGGGNLAAQASTGDPINRKEIALESLMGVVVNPVVFTARTARPGFDTVYSKLESIANEEKDKRLGRQSLNDQSKKSSTIYPSESQNQGQKPPDITSNVTTSGGVNIEALKKQLVDVDNKRIAEYIPPIEPAVITEQEVKTTPAVVNNPPVNAGETLTEVDNGNLIKEKLDGSSTNKPKIVVNKVENIDDVVDDSRKPDGTAVHKILETVVGEILPLMAEKYKNTPLFLTREKPKNSENVGNGVWLKDDGSIYLVFKKTKDFNRKAQSLSKFLSEQLTTDPISGPGTLKKINTGNNLPVTPETNALYRANQVAQDNATSLDSVDDGSDNASNILAHNDLGDGTATNDAHTDALNNVTSKLTPESQSITNWIGTLIENAPSEGYKQITEKLADIIKKVEEKGYRMLISIHTQEAIDNTAYRKYFKTGVKAITDRLPDGGYEILLRSSKQTGNNGASFETMLHELIHVVTDGKITAYLNRDPNAVPLTTKEEQALLDLIELKQELQRAVKKADKGTLPGPFKRWLTQSKGGKVKTNVLTNEHEILPWALSNPEVRTWMRNTEFKGTKRSYTGTFYTSLKNLLGLNKQTEESILGRALGIFNDLVNDGHWMENNQQAKIDATGVIATPPLDAVVVAEGFRAGDEILKHTAKLIGFNLTKSFAKRSIEILENLKIEFNRGEVKLRSFNDFRILEQLSSIGLKKNFEESPEGSFTLLESPNLTGGGFAVVVHTMNKELIATIQKQLPNINILDIEGAKIYFYKGITPVQAVASWNNNRVQAAALAEIYDDKSASKLYSNNDLSIAEALFIVADKIKNNKVRDLKTNVFDLFATINSRSSILDDNPILQAVRTTINNEIKVPTEQFTREVLMPLRSAVETLTQEQAENVVEALVLADENMVDLTTDMLVSSNFSQNEINVIEMFYKADAELFNIGNRERQLNGEDPIKRRAGHFPSEFGADYRTAIMLKPDGDKPGKVVHWLTARTRSKLIEEREKYINQQDDPDSVEATNVIRRGLNGDEIINGRKFFGESYKTANDPNNINNNYFKHQTPIQQIYSKSAKFGNEAETYLGRHHHAKLKSGVGGALGRSDVKTRKENTEHAITVMFKYLEELQQHHAVNAAVHEITPIFFGSTEGKSFRDAYPNTLKYVSTLLSSITGKVDKHTEHQSHTYRTLLRVGRSLDAPIDAIYRLAGRGASSSRGASAFSREWFATTAMGMMNTAFMFMQYVQLPLFAVPLWIQMKFESPKRLDIQDKSDIGSSFTNAVQLYSIISQVDNGVSYRKTKQYKGMSLEEQEIVDYAIDNSIVSVENFDAQSQSFGLGHGPKTRSFMKWLNWSRNFPERTTRPLAFYMFLRTLRKQGVPLKPALDQAYQNTQLSMFNYDQLHRPIAFRSMGEMGKFAAQLQVFVAGTYHYLAYMGVKPAARLPMIGAFFALQVSMNGLEDSAGTDEIEWVLGLISSMTGDGYFSYKAWMKENVSKPIRVGLVSTVTGTATGTRTRIQSVPELFERLYGVASADFKKVISAFPAISYWGGNVINTFDYVWPLVWHFENDSHAFKELVRGVTFSSGRYVFDNYQIGGLGGWRRDEYGNKYDSEGKLIMPAEYRTGEGEWAAWTGLPSNPERDYRDTAWLHTKNKHKYNREKADASKAMKAFIIKNYKKMSMRQIFNDPRMNRLMEEAYNKGVDLDKTLSNKKINEMIAKNEMGQEARALEARGPASQRRAEKIRSSNTLESLFGN